MATHELRLPIRVFVDPRSLPDDPGIEPCLALTSIHELGHAIGIFAHSDDPEDIMFTDPEVDLPSNRDITTAEAAYHTQVQSPGRPAVAPLGHIGLSYGRGGALIPARGMPIFPAPQEAAG